LQQLRQRHQHNIDFITLHDTGRQFANCASVMAVGKKLSSTPVGPDALTPAPEIFQNFIFSYPIHSTHPTTRRHDLPPDHPKKWPNLAPAPLPDGAVIPT
jgi:hypothetical protein